MKRLITAAVGALLLLLAAASVALIGGSTTSQAAGTPSSAYGIAAEGPIPIPATPQVVSEDGKPTSDSAGSFPDNPLLTGGLLEVSAQNGKASASVASLAVGDGLLEQLPPELKTQLETGCQQLADALEPATGGVDDGLDEATTELEGALDQVAAGAADSPLDLSALGELDVTGLTDLQLDGLCNVLAGEAPLVKTGLIQSSCTGDSGSSHVERGTALGLPLNVDTESPNSALEIPGLIKVTLDRQTSNPDGTFTVDALVINLFGEEEITLASATCGRVSFRDVDPTQQAPSPTPVPTHHAVTG